MVSSAGRKQNDAAIRKIKTEPQEQADPVLWETKRFTAAKMKQSSLLGNKNAVQPKGAS